MNALLQAAAEVQQFLRNAGERFCFIGGIAVQRWGEPRLTRDVDLTLLCPYGAEAPAAQRLLASFAPRIPDAAAFAARNRVLLLNSAGQVPIDIAMGAIPFEERCVERASEYDLGGATLLTCCAEDLVVMKAFAGRDRDWADIQSIASRQGPALDWALIFEEFAPLAALREGQEANVRLRAIKGSAVS